MGYWGHKIWESDQALDTLSEISSKLYKLGRRQDIGEARAARAALTVLLRALPGRIFVTPAQVQNMNENCEHLAVGWGEESTYLRVLKDCAKEGEALLAAAVASDEAG